MENEDYIVPMFLITVFVPAGIVSCLLLLMLCIIPLLGIIFLLMIFGGVYLMHRWTVPVLSKIHVALREDRLPKNAFVLYSPFFLPLFYALMMSAISFSDLFDTIEERIEFFFPVFFPYFLFVLFVRATTGYGGSAETVASVVVFSTFLTMCVGSLWLLCFSRRRIRHLPTVLVFGLLGAALYVPVLHNRTRMHEQTLWRDESIEQVKEPLSLAFDRDDIDYYLLKPYIPFSKRNELETIDEEIKLRFESEHPRLYGALPLYPLYTTAVQAMYKNVSAEQAAELLQAGTNSEALTALVDGKADMVFLISPYEKQVEKAEKAAGQKFSITPICRDAFVFFVSQENPIDELSNQEIRDIYSKKIVRWSELGGQPLKISAFQRPEGSESQAAMRQFMGSQPLDKPIQEVNTMSDESFFYSIANYRNCDNSIGYSFRRNVAGMFKHDNVKLLRIDNIEPSPQNIRNGSYPLGGEIVVVIADTKNPNVPKLMNWFLSPQGQILIEQVGFIPLY